MSHFLNALHKFQLKPLKILQMPLFQFQQDGGIRHAILRENGAIPWKDGRFPGHQMTAHFGNRPDSQCDSSWRTMFTLHCDILNQDTKCYSLKKPAIRISQVN